MKGREGGGERKGDTLTFFASVSLALSAVRPAFACVSSVLGLTCLFVFDHSPENAIKNRWYSARRARERSHVEAPHWDMKFEKKVTTTHPIIGKDTQTIDQDTTTKTHTPTAPSLSPLPFPPPHPSPLPLSGDHGLLRVLQWWGHVRPLPARRHLAPTREGPRGLRLVSRRHQPSEAAPEAVGGAQAAGDQVRRGQHAATGLPQGQGHQGNTCT